MNTIVTILSISCTTFLLSGGPFQNLDFESPHIKAVQNSMGRPSVSDALPGWSVIVADQPANRVFYNNMAIDSASATLWDHGVSTSYPFQGRFNAQISAGEWELTYGSSSLYQIGDIPTDAKSLLFTAVIGNRRNLEVDLSGQAMHLVVLGGDALLTR